MSKVTIAKKEAKQASDLIDDLAERLGKMMSKPEPPPPVEPVQEYGITTRSVRAYWRDEFGADHVVEYEKGDSIPISPGGEFCDCPDGPVPGTAMCWDNQGRLRRVKPGWACGHKRD